jgi:hypothetical protein
VNTYNLLNNDDDGDDDDDDDDNCLVYVKQGYM